MSIDERDVRRAAKEAAAAAAHEEDRQQRLRDAAEAQARQDGAK